MTAAVSARFAPFAWWLVRPQGRPFAPWTSAREQHEASRALCAMHGVDVRVEGSKTAGPALYAANHVGYFDPFVIGATVECLSVAKVELSRWPFVGRRMRELGVLFVDRGRAPSGARVIRAMVRALRVGASVLNFPEGTTTDGADVLPFHRGAFGAARLAGVPVVPVRVDYDDPRVAWTGDALFLPHYAATLARGPVRARVRFGAPFDPRDCDDARAAAARAHAVVRSMNPCSSAR